MTGFFLSSLILLKLETSFPPFLAEWSVERVGQFLEEKGFEKEVIEKFAGKLPLMGSTKC